jgi:hypothetical protein
MDAGGYDCTPELAAVFVSVAGAFSLHYLNNVVTVKLKGELFILDIKFQTCAFSSQQTPITLDTLANS